MLLLRVYNKFGLETEDLLIESFSFCSELFVSVEESISRLQNLSLINTPSLTELVHDILISVQAINCSLKSNIVESNNTV